MSRVTALIARFKGGSHSAYHALFAAYFPGLVSAADRRLGPAPAGPADAEDVALSAFFGLWREVADGRPLGDGLTDRDSLLRALAVLTAQKARRARRDACRRKRDARRTVRAADMSAAERGAWDGLSDQSSAPDTRALFGEALAEALGLLTPLQQEIVEYKLVGHTNPEIAQLAGCSLRTVERQLSEVRSLWVERGLLGARPAD